MNKQQVEQLARKYNLTPSKSKGQNFLIDNTIVEDIVEVSGVGKGDRVLEIGPGLGVLTQELLKKETNVHVVELDDQALRYLKDNFKNTISIIEGDILNYSNQELHDQVGGEYHVVANIPYNITSKILRKFTEQEPKPLSMTLMIQKEVAQRISAKPGQLSILGIAVQFYADVSYAFNVTKEKFWPIPKVDSAVVHMTFHTRYQEKLQVSERDFFRIIKFGFAAKRKKLANNISAGLQIPLEEVRELLEKHGLQENARAQELSIDQWIELANVVYSQK